MNNSVNLKQLESTENPIHSRISQVLKKRMSRGRRQTDTAYNLPKDSHKHIAERIMSKLQNWPSKQKKTSKKFYWTKDYSYCAFVDESEIEDGKALKKTSERIYVATKCGRQIDLHTNENYTPEALRGSHQIYAKGL